MTITGEQKVIGSIIVLSLVILVGGIFMLSGQDQQVEEQLSIPLMGDTILGAGASHLADGEFYDDYSSDPAVIGPHWQHPAGAGMKNTDIPDESLIHSMEHGAVIVYYNPELSEDDITLVKDAFISASGKKIIVPRENLDVPVALGSWGQLLKLSEINTDTIVQFIEVNNDRAPEKAPI